VEEHTVFPSGTFTYAVRISEEVKELRAEFEGHNVLLYLPAALGKGWADNAVVGFENEQELPEGDKLKLLLEKDFACLEQRDEDDRDTYPNPKANTV